MSRRPPLLTPARSLRPLKDIETVAFAPEGATLAAAGEGGAIRLWEMASGRQARVFGGDELPVIALAFAPGADLLATASGNAARLWEPGTGRAVRTLAHETPVTAVGFLPDGKTVFTLSWGFVFYSLDQIGERNYRVNLWDVEGGDLDAAIKVSGESLWSLALSPDGRTLAGASGSRMVKVWDLAAGRETQVLTGHTDLVAAVAFSPDGATLATGGRDETVRLWNTTTWQLTRTLAHQDRVDFLAFAGGTRLVTLDGGNTATVWDTATGVETAFLIEGHNVKPGYINAAALSPDGALLATASRTDDAVQIWSLDTART